MRFLLLVAAFGSGLSISAIAQGQGGVAVTARGSNNQLKVDGQTSTQAKYRQLGIEAEATFSTVKPTLGLAHLERQVDDLRAQGKMEKDSSIVTPGIVYSTGAGLELAAAYQVINTRVANDYVENHYELPMSRGVLGAALVSMDSRASISLASEARKERTYDSIGGYPAIDRDYIPWQLDLGYERDLTSRLRLTSGVRYSHYNDDVYKDQYESSVPQAPTLAQVFDYLLSAKVGAGYELTDSLDLSASLARKAALDTNSLTGDEYLVGYIGAIGLDAEFNDASTAGFSLMTSSGQKNHDVQGKTYGYANRVEGVEGKFAVRI